MVQCDNVGEMFAVDEINQRAIAPSQLGDHDCHDLRPSRGRWVCSCCLRARRQAADVVITQPAVIGLVDQVMRGEAAIDPADMAEVSVTRWHGNRGGVGAGVESGGERSRNRCGR